MEDLTLLIETELNRTAQILGLLLQAELTDTQRRHMQAARDAIRGRTKHADADKRLGAAVDLMKLVSDELGDALNGYDTG